MKRSINLFFVFFMLLTIISFASDNVSETYLKQSDLADGYYLNISSGSDKNRIKENYVEVWSTISPATKKYYVQKYGSLVHAPPISNIGIERYYYANGISGDTFRYHKGANAKPGWKETTPNGKKLGDRCCSITQSFHNGDTLSITIIAKGKYLYIITLDNKRHSKSIPKESAEKLIETIYIRL